MRFESAPAHAFFNQKRGCKTLQPLFADKNKPFENIYDMPINYLGRQRLKTNELISYTLNHN